MTAQIIHHPKRPDFPMIERPDGHVCPACRTAILSGDGVAPCRVCGVMLRTQTYTAPVYRARTLLAEELAGLARLDDAGANPLDMHPDELAAAICPDLQRPRSDPEPARPFLSAGDALWICAVAVIGGPLIGWALAGFLQ